MENENTAVFGDFSNGITWHSGSLSNIESTHCFTQKTRNSQTRKITNQQKWALRAENIRKPKNMFF